MTSHGQCPRGWVLVKNPVSAPGPPPPFKNPGSAPVTNGKYNTIIAVGKMSEIMLLKSCWLLKRLTI